MNSPAFFNFAEHQARSRRHSTILVALFLLVTAAIALVIGAVIALVLGGVEEVNTASRQPGATVYGVDLAVVIGVAILVMGIILVTAGLRSLMLGGDGAKVAQSLGGTEVTRDTENPAKRQLFNVVEEISIAANLPMPRVFVIKHEQGINAFAAGRKPENAVIGVTHGALASLNRPELTGVIAHEFGHIANGDMRLNMRLMAMIFGLVALSIAGRILMRSMLIRGGARRDQRAVMVAMVLGITLTVLGALGVLAGRIMQAAVSRSRERLADATSVQYTREPESLANALKKIGALQQQEQLNNPHREEVRHMMFAEAVSRFSPGMLATHPPLIERIRALEPGFDPATDPLWIQPQKEMIRESRRELKKEREVLPLG